MRPTLPRLIFYFRANCHLCEDMWQHLLEVRSQRSFDIVQVDVDSESGLQQRFGTLVPVLAGDDRIICHYYLDPVALDSYLTGTV